MRCVRLRAHLQTDPLLLLIGEAPGFRGCRITGVGFTSERLVVEGAVPRVTTNGARISSRATPFSEASASIVWGALYRHGLAERTVLWNAFAWHPHQSGNGQTNRTPTKQELDAGKDVLKELLRAFVGTPIVAVGRTAEVSLKRLGVIPQACFRHPAMGGATDFRRGLARWAAESTEATDGAMTLSLTA